MHRDAASSARLHLLQELSTLGQPLVHALLFREGLGGVKPMFPASTSRPGQPFGGSQSGTGTAVHPASSIGHCRGLTRRASGSRRRIFAQPDYFTGLCPRFSLITKYFLASFCNFCFRRLVRAFSLRTSSNESA